MPRGVVNQTTPVSVAEVEGPQREPLRAVKAEQAAEEAEAEDGERQAPHRDRTSARRGATRPLTNRPARGHRTPGGLSTYSLPGARAVPTWVDSWPAPESAASVDRVAPGHRFDSTRGFPGEGPTDLANIPWFLKDPSTRSLRDRKRHRSSAPPAATIKPRARGGRPSTDRKLSFALSHGHTKTRSRIGRAGVGIAPAVAGDRLTTPGATPVPQASPRKVRDFATPREQRDFLTPLPFVPAGQSLRRAFIKHFGGLRGMDPASFDEVWKVAKNGYNQAHDAHFVRFRTDFLTHSPLPRFNPTGIHQET